MIVCYAHGGGLGHLTRIRAYLYTVHGDAPATILSASPFGADPRVVGPHRVLPVRGPVGDVLRELRASTFVVDAFPGGIDGELTGTMIPSGVRTVHLARLLREEAYRRRPLNFDQVFLVEELTGHHRAALSGIAGSVVPLELTDPPSTSADLADGAWLIPHSGPSAEIHELISYARECAGLEGVRPRLVLASPGRPASLPDDVEHLDGYPAWPLFARAARVISAAGFNVVRQMRPWRDKHRMLPFPRRWDDQFTRAARARR
ncbi:hypothetical protein [Actinoplanes sp. L3-i22]|uniref:hypothetical protein n=1 Tax=Actinoplanes sp. L3-i22 TaxID=2836373 RepID=UPI001C74DA8F|nr:hypothetical protein [Actinoplanes sp. L3-i22]BCY10159.1 hypothetical protein L3i22_052470 [Actinoplanes sp. L3-i22]